tara:strand:+ start:424 stop:1413 length:990 start_codon:yes stop_codon:yes gene_type:complete
MSGTPLQSGYMSPQLLNQIVSKATSECRVTNFALYNWTEPFIHPKLPEMIRTVKAHGIGCDISTNLNLGKQIEAVVAAKPDTIKISVSGFNQESYGVTHRGGDVEVVKENMKRLSKAKTISNSTTRILVIFHRYIDNQAEEAKMRNFASGLGFDFTTYWAYLMPIEKNLAFLGHKKGLPALTEEDRTLVGRLALPLSEALKISKESNVSHCKLRDSQMAINSQGKVMLCCSVFDQSRYTLSDFLTTPLKDLQKKKYSHEMCTTCMSEGLHVLMTYGDKKLEKMTLENVKKNNPGLDLEAAYQKTKHPSNNFRSFRKRMFAAVDRYLHPA